MVKIGHFNLIWAQNFAYRAAFFFKYYEKNIYDSHILNSDMHLDSRICVPNVVYTLNKNATIVEGINFRAMVYFKSFISMKLPLK